MEKKKLTYEGLLDIIKLQTEIVQEGMNLANIMELVTWRAKEITEADGACIELIERNDFIHSSAVGIAEKILGLCLSVGIKLSDNCITEKKPLVNNDIESDEEENTIVCRNVGLNSMIVVPLICENEVVGILKVFSKEKNHFDDIHIQTLGMLSDLIANSMSSALRNGSSRLLYEATHDSLTGISNRAFFYDQLRKKIKNSNTRNVCLGIIVLDMNGLKDINDIYGHRAGDAAIKEVVNRIKLVLSLENVFSRLGGDEFGIIITATSIDKFNQLMERIHLVLEEIFIFEGNELPLSVSIGFSFLNIDGKDVDTLMEKADQVMYERKRMIKRK